MENRQQQDLELWREWKKTNNPQTLEKLLKRLQPLISREVSKWGATVPTAALESKGRMLTVEALQNYDPTRGAAIGTHVTSRLRKLSRHVYPYQNVVRLPENKQLMFHTVTVAQNNLYDSLGRDPTVDELADELKWSPRKVTSFQRDFGRKEFGESEGTFLETDTEDSTLTDFYYHGLAPDDKKLFEDITGYGGVRPKTNAQLRSKHKLTQGQLSYRKRKFVNDIKGIQQGRY